MDVWCYGEEKAGSVPGGMMLQQSPLLGIKLPSKPSAEGCFSSPQKKSKKAAVSNTTSLV